MVATFEQFVVFGTDNAGIERSLRFFQAACLFLTSYPILISLLLSRSPSAIHVIARTSLSQIHDRINVTRRLLRFFRFLEYFQSGWILYVSDYNGIEIWLDVLGRSCLGIFGMLESATLFDLLQIEFFEFFGAQQTMDLNYQAQLFWIIALYTSILSSGIKMIRSNVYHGVPKTGAGFGTIKISKQEASDDKLKEDVGTQDIHRILNEKMEQDGMEDMNIVRQPEQNENRGDKVKESTEQTSTLFMKIIADGLDLILPTAAVGWIEVDKGVIGIVMMITTILTVDEIWERCGRELRCRRGQ
ncbi:hypothetical protein PT974_11873 [Cladobotryum mycophilum]|uniref:AoPex11B-like protein n=1 Tax=Cladobotryum mycophilum TaxID=491253 RepID=A0ABR0S7J0_9HYPO